jgi:hypothetical protein
LVPVQSEPEEILWSPYHWSCNCFPLPAEDAEILDLQWVIDVLQKHVDTCTEWDTTALGRALHVGHLLTLMQAPDGTWPAIINGRTGDAIGEARTLAPIPLFQRMGRMLQSTEFDHVLKKAGLSPDPV